MSDHNGKLTIDCGPADAQGKRLVVAKCNGYSHRDRFAVDSAFHRGKFRDAVISRFQWGDEAHEAIEAALIRAADAEDSRGEQEPLATPKLVCLADVQPIETEWLWEGRFPIGSIIDLSGDPGLGKSQLILDIAARITRGDTMPPSSAPDGTYEPRHVLVLSAEDDAARTIRPRVDAAGGNVRRVHLLQAVTITGCEGEERAVCLPIDIEPIEQVVIAKRIVLIVVDVFEAHLADGMNPNANADMRRCLTPLARMAERHACTVVLVRHLNKKPGGAALYRGGGSIGIIGACRAGFVVAADPNDPETKVLACTKINLGPSPDSLAFTIEGVASGSSRSRWIGKSDATANELLASDRDRSGGKLAVAKEIIVGILAGGPRGENEIRGACHASGISEATYRRARKDLRIISEKTEFGGGQWMLTLPTEATY